ncbi:MAG TPA: hypothetical protein VGG66_04785 [Rhizomicrobium sp.]
MNFADVEASRAGPHQQAIDIEPGQIAQLGQTARGKFSIHVATLIARSRTLKL